MIKTNSAKTSNRQIPALHKWFVKEYDKLPHDSDGISILDYGCGKYNNGIDYLRENLQAVVLGYDPHNRDDDHNRVILDIKDIFTVALCANVLNVIDSDEVITDVINDLYKRASTVYISVYEGEGSGAGCYTTKGYQRNMKLADYIPLLKNTFTSVERYGKVLMCY